MDSASPARRNWCASVLLLIFGLLASGWGLSSFPEAWRRSNVPRIAALIAAGQPYNADGLVRLGQLVRDLESEDVAGPEVWPSVAMIQLRIAEQALIGREGPAIDENFQRLNRVIRRSLSQVPADPFLWFILFWLENAQSGFRPDNIKYLRLSYTAGPNEGWVSVRRNRFALAIYPMLPRDLGDRAVTEFLALMKSGFYAETADVYRSIGSEAREALLARMREVPEGYRAVLSKRLFELGYDFVIPGIAQPKSTRPWN